MLMLSLMVTAAVQVVTALTDLRGRNLASGLENLMSQIDPEFREKTTRRVIDDCAAHCPSCSKTPCDCSRRNARQGRWQG